MVLRPTRGPSCSVSSMRRTFKPYANTTYRSCHSLYLLTRLEKAA